MPDITLEDDLLGLEDDLANTRGSQPDMIVAPDNVIPLVTFFENLRREQKETRSSRWGPFEDEDKGERCED
jgi:hypothetical protein